MKIIKILIIILILAIVSTIACLVYNKYSKKNKINNTTKTIPLNQVFSLCKNETAKIENTQSMLEITKVMFSPCPKGSMCLTSGMSAEWKLTIGSRTYESDKLSIDKKNNLPYQIAIYSTNNHDCVTEAKVLKK